MASMTHEGLRGVCGVRGPGLPCTASHGCTVASSLGVGERTEAWP